MCTFTGRPTMTKISYTVGSSSVSNAANVVAPAVQFRFGGKFNSGRSRRLFAFGTSLPWKDGKGEKKIVLGIIIRRTTVACWLNGAFVGLSAARR